MDLNRKLFLIQLTVLLLLVQQIKCSLNEINTILLLSSDISSSSEEENIENKIINNQNIITTFDRIEELNFSTTTERTEASKTAMDIITIVWYTSTFLALAAFFFLMACSDKRCGRHNPANSMRNRNDSIQYPPSPAPSYREFAPPSYEDIMKQAIYVIPIDKDSNIKISPLKDNYCIVNDVQQQQQQNIIVSNEQQQQHQQQQEQQQQQHNIETNTRLHIINEFSSNEQSKNG